MLSSTGWAVFKKTFQPNYYFEIDNEIKYVKAEIL